MGLFDKKYCEFCGEKIGFLGNKKLADGNMCKKCASRMSPWVEDRKHWTVGEMREHFEYRDENFEKLKSFKVSGVLGRDGYKMYIDLEHRWLFVTEYDNYLDTNPDIISFDQIDGYEYEVKESRRELYFRDSENHSRSYSPPEYDYDYNFYVRIYVKDFFRECLNLKLNRFTVDEEMDPKFVECEDTLDCFREVLENITAGRDFRVPRQLELDARTRSDMTHDLNRFKNDRRRYLDDYAREYNRGGRSFGSPVGRQSTRGRRGGRNYW